MWGELGGQKGGLDVKKTGEDWGDSGGPGEGVQWRGLGIKKLAYNQTSPDVSQLTRVGLVF